MAKDPEEQARDNIDTALELAGWRVQDRDTANLTAGAGVAVREFALKRGPLARRLEDAGIRVHQPYLHQRFLLTDGGWRPDER